MKTIKMVALAATLLSFAGCSSTSSPDKVSASIIMGDTVTTLRSFSSSINGNSVVVLGSIATPDPCYDFSASVTMTGNVLEATVIATHKAGTCAAALKLQTYTLTIGNIPNGSWVFRVLHQEDGKTPILEYDGSATIK